MSLPKSIFPLLAALLLGVAMAPLAHANLVFEATEISHTAKVEEDAFTAVFKFKNEGADTVTIKKVNTSCGCTTAELPKKVYAPGEKGELSATFKYGEFQGFQMKTIGVETSKETYQLTIEVEIPEFVKFDPPLVSWQVGDELTPQTFTVKVAKDAPYKDLKVEFETPSAFSGTLEETKKGREYTLTVTPTSTEKFVRSQIYLKTDFPKNKPKVFKAFCMVKPASASPSEGKAKGTPRVSKSVE